MCAARRDRLAEHLAHAAERFGVRSEGDLVRGDFDRTLAVRTSGPAWLRVTAQRPEWTTELFWDGIASATGSPFDEIPMPRHLATTQWADGGYVVRADLVTYVDRRAVGSGLVLRRDADLPGAWWDALRAGLAPLRRATGTRRAVLRPDALRSSLLASFGVEIDPGRLDWEVAHGDLHFGNLTAPGLTILDWETWGWAPAGYDAAVLACSAVLRPDVAARVRAELPVPPTYSGAVARLAAADKYLSLVRLGRHPDVAVPLRRQAEAVLREGLVA
ncbi:phosphotransferase [Promicromonospora sp. NPDC052451]|uniref:phosphotransferase n=1 Tax=Promicromonospora sp. NPDC052451 TaxID=3364407 RepID=UPI0037CA9D40